MTRWVAIGLGACVIACAPPSAGSCQLLDSSDVAPLLGATKPLAGIDRGPACTWTNGSRYFSVVQLSTGKHETDQDLIYAHLRRKFNGRDEPTMGDTVCSFWRQRSFNVMLMAHGRVVALLIKRDADSLTQDSVGYTDRLRDAMRPLVKKASDALGQKIARDSAA